MHHNEAFLRIVDEARVRIKETDVTGVKALRDRGASFYLVDVREESEWASGRVPGAVHMGKGIIERDIEGRIPDRDAHVVLYCGGGFRSALVADNLQRMGYTNVYSMDGGIRSWRAVGLPIETD
jgi:rhodanese-related sulfurtransferase